MITIIDCGMGNLGSILNMLKKIGSEAVISSEVSVIKEASKLILPGVGSFRNDTNTKARRLIIIKPSLLGLQWHSKNCF